MPLPRPILSWCLLGVMLATAAGCDAGVGRRLAPEREQRFARQYLRALADSGGDRVLSRTAPATRESPGFANFLDTLRGVLQRVPSDSMVLHHWSVKLEAGHPRRTKMVYAVHGLEAPFLVGVWIEPAPEDLVVNTVFYGSPPAKGRLPGDS